jgi:hypothetical protein
VLMRAGLILSCHFHTSRSRAWSGRS